MIDAVCLIPWTLFMFGYIAWVLLGSPRNREEWAHRYSMIRRWMQ